MLASIFCAHLLEQTKAARIGLRAAEFLSFEPRLIVCA
jgi:hypothetical protein